MAKAGAEATATLDDARARGEDEARAAAAGELARLRREARERVLRTRRDAYDQLVEDAEQAVAGLRHDPEYERLLDALRHRAREQLGDAGVEVEIDPEVGGLVARAGSHSVDYRLSAVAERALSDLGAQVDPRWW